MHWALNMYVLWPPPKEWKGLRICMLDTTHRPYCKSYPFP